MIEILLIEDESLIGEMVRLNLEQEGYRVTWVRDGEAGTREALSGRYAVALVDWMLPGRPGVEIVREMKEQGVATPALILTALSDLPSRVEGLDAGADDYLTKPFEVPELLARVRVLLRRSGVA